MFIDRLADLIRIMVFLVMLRFGCRMSVFE
jgi:hypothetical protein